MSALPRRLPAGGSSRPPGGLPRSRPSGLARLASLSPRLLAWFADRRRDLPWRASRDPYAILVSEVMLQQTRVEAVLPYYRRFLARFPTVAELAAAPLPVVLAVWSGLGYYRRARQLHAAARRLATAGGFPRRPEALRALPGVGPYTAAAVASIAFGVPVAALDGNAERVLARLLAVPDPRRVEGRRRIEAAAQALLDPRRPGESNQALMELGALVCTPRRPACPECPLSTTCAARRTGDPAAYPRPRRRRATVRSRLLAAVVRRGGRVLLVRRPEESPLLPGFWEIPWVELDEDGGTAAEGRLATRYGGTWRLGERRGEVRHAVTFRALGVEVREAELAGGEWAAEGVEAGWFSAAELAELPLPALAAKVLGLAGPFRRR